VLSIFSNLRETFRLWWQNLGYLTALTLAGFWPIFGIKYLEYSISDQSSLVFILIKSFDMFWGAFATIIQTVFVLGLLRQDPTKKPLWLGIWSTIKISTAPLLGAFLLIWLLSAVIALLAYMLFLIFDRDNLLLFNWLAVFLALPAFGCVLFKYALTPPIIVMENMAPWTALCQSWKMTKGYFWYVAGNCLFLSGAMWFMHHMINTHILGSGAVTMGILLVLNFGCAVFNQIGVVLLWCMYLQIKEAEVVPSSDAVQD